MHKKGMFWLMLIFYMVSLGLLKAAETKVACIGNSVTAGLGLQHPLTQSYPAALQVLLGSNYKVGNFGHSGATLLKKGHNPYYKTKEFEKLLSFKPDIAIIHLGLNDTDPRNWPHYKDDFIGDYVWLLNRLKAMNPRVKLFVCVMTPIFSGHPRFKSGTQNWYGQIQKLLPTIALNNGAEIINLHEDLYHRPDLFEDNIHPNEEGAAIIANTVYKKLTGKYGGLRLPAVFGTHMVIQRQKPIKIYGKADANELITVQLNTTTCTVRTNSDGDWDAVLPSMEAGGPYQLNVQGRDSSIHLNDILIGDVWLCSGQSNMEFALSQALNSDKLINSTKNNRQLRLYHLRGAHETNNEAWESDVLRKTNRLQYFDGSWVTNTEKNASDFSAIAYAFGTKIEANIHVPIGLIQVAVGGSGIESWIDRRSLEKDPLLVDMLDNWRKSDFIMDWCRERADINLQKATNKLQRHPYEPAYNFESGIAPLKNFAVKGVLWYQGESNTHNIELYNTLFRTFVKSWRQQWGDSLPFFYVQLSSIDRPSWPDFRNVQRQLQKEIPNVWMAVSADLGDSLDVHPRLKLPIGERLANLALQHTYNQKIDAEAPEVIHISSMNNKLILIFDHARELHTNDKRSIMGFEVILANGEQLQVKGKCHRNKVIIDLPYDKEIRFLRYAWQPFTRANLVNEKNIPVSTFCWNLRE